MDVLLAVALGAALATLATFALLAVVRDRIRRHPDRFLDAAPWDQADAWDPGQDVAGHAAAEVAHGDAFDCPTCASSRARGARFCLRCGRALT